MLEIAMSPTATTLTISGDLDLAERDQFPEVAARVTGLRRQLLVLDMCRVTFLDSTGAAFLISLADSARKRGGAAVLRGCLEPGPVRARGVRRAADVPDRPRAPLRGAGARRPGLTRPGRPGQTPVGGGAGSTSAQTTLPCAVGSQPHSASRSTICMP